MTLTRHRIVITFAVIAALTGMVAVVSAQGTEKTHSVASNAGAQTIRGVWRTVVTPYNCQTGQPLASHSGLFTFNQGGSMSEYGIGPGSTPALRSPGHGVWQREPGRRRYSLAFTFYRYDGSGVFLGSVKIAAGLRLGASGDEFSSRSAIDILDVTDKVVGIGCATAVGTRFE